MIRTSMNYEVSCNACGAQLTTSPVDKSTLKKLVQENNWAMNSEVALCSACSGLAGRLHTLTPKGMCDELMWGYTQYGGTLVQLNLLPLGTRFHVCNGAYDAIIVGTEENKEILPLGAPGEPRSFVLRDIDLASITVPMVYAEGKSSLDDADDGDDDIPF